MTIPGDVQSSLGLCIRRWREAKPYTRAALANVCDITQASLSRIEHDRQVPNPQLWDQLCDKLAIPPNESVSVYVHADCRCGRLIAVADYYLHNAKPKIARHFVVEARRMNAQQYEGRYNGELYRVRGRLALATHRYDSACHYFWRWMDAVKPKGSRQNIARSYFDYGLALSRVGKPLNAIRYLLRAGEVFRDLQLAGLEAKCLWALGDLLLVMGSFQEAQEQFVQSRALISDPGSQQVVRLGEIMAYIGMQRDWSWVKSELNNMQPVTPTAAPLWFYIHGVLCRLQSQWDEALYLQQESLRLKPGPALKAAALLELGVVYWHVGHVEEAKHVTIMALKVVSGNYTMTYSDSLVLRVLARRLDVPIPVVSMPNSPDWEQRLSMLQLVDFPQPSQ